MVHKVIVVNLRAAVGGDVVGPAGPSIGPVIVHTQTVVVLTAQPQTRVLTETVLPEVAPVHVEPVIRKWETLKNRFESCISTFCCIRHNL